MNGEPKINFLLLKKVKEARLLRNQAYWIVHNKFLYGRELHVFPFHTIKYGTH